jgi:hypothetical protein
MNGRHDGALRLEFFREIKREQNLRQFALPVAASGGVASREHHVVEVDRRLCDRRDIHHARLAAVGE